MKIVEFCLLNFSTPVAFYSVFHLLGPRPAIGIAVLITILQAAVQRLRGLDLSPFFVVASAFTLVFGALDLAVPRPRFFRLEPFAENALLGLIFIATLFTRRPIVAWFAEALPEKWRLRLGPEAAGYLRRLTVVWAAYFLLKSLVFFWIALQVDLARLVVLRTIIGGGSLVLMFVGELAYRQWRSKRRVVNC